jgi:hypothetical protein
MCLKSLFVDNVHTTLFTLLSHIMNRFFQPAITAVLLSAALVLLAALPSSAGIGDGRHLVRNLSDNAANNSDPQIDGSNVVWYGGSYPNVDIYLHDGTSVTNLSNNGASNSYPQIDGSNVVWSSGSYLNYDIYLHDGTNLANLSNNGASNYSPQISGSSVVWQGNADGNDDIYAAYWLGPDAVLNNVDLSGEDLSDVDFSAVDLQTVVGLGATVGNALYSPATFFPSGFDPVAQGWTLVPEPHTLLLASLASMGLTLRRRGLTR